MLWFNEFHDEGDEWKHECVVGFHGVSVRMEVCGRVMFRSWFSSWFFLHGR